MRPPPCAVIFFGVPILWLVFVVGSTMALPVDGICHLYMPVVCLLGLPKLLLVTPALLWACWLGIPLQLLMILCPQRVLSRLLSMTLLGVVLVAGVASLLGQTVALLPGQEPAPVAQALREAKFRELPIPAGEDTRRGGA